MMLNTAINLLAAAPGGPPPPAWIQFFSFILIFVIFYFLLIRPQQKRAREHEALIKTLKPGDKVVTNGGVIGVIITVKEKSVSLRSADTKLEILKSAVSQVTERAGESS
jgi:preprotein translocase subunit YajC